MEEKYFLGKKVNSAFINPSVGFEQYCTLKNLDFNGVYEIENIYLTCGGDVNLYLEYYKRLANLFPEIKSTREFIDHLSQFDAFIRFNEFCFDRRISSGIFMLAIAIAQGYENIYLVGIDMFANKGNMYAFDVSKKKVMGEIDKRLIHSKVDKIHSTSFDEEAIRFLLKSYPNVNIYCICPTSPLADILPSPAKKSDRDTDFALDKKDMDADFILPTSGAYKTYKRVTLLLMVKRRIKNKLIRVSSVFVNIFSKLRMLKKRILSVFK